MMMQKTRNCLGLVLLCIGSNLAAVATAAEEPAVGSLTCEFMTDPYGVEAPNPSLGWKMESTVRAQKQTAYHVLVASNRANLDLNEGDAWDSGKVVSEPTAYIRYAGATLVAAKRYYWKVRVWDKDDRPTAWSTPALWGMGLLAPTDWHGQWIGGDTSKEVQKAALLLRKTISLNKKIKQATVFISGLGWSELYVNGSRVGDDVQSPSIANYQFRVPYLVYDITKILSSGPNTIGVLLANGYYSPGGGGLVCKWSNDKKLRLDLLVEYEDQTSETIVSDPSWKWSLGEYTSAEYNRAVDIDLGQIKSGWDTSTYDDAAWQAVMVKEAPGGVMSSIPHPLTQVIGSLTPTIAKGGVFKLPKDCYYTGYPWLRTQGKKGQQIKIGAGVKSSAVLQGGQATEEIDPRFTYHTVNRFTVTGLTQAPKPEDVQWRCVGNGLRPVGGFLCSDETLNYLHDSVVRQLRNAFIHGIVIESAEKSNWLIEPNNLLELSIFNFDSLAFYRKLEWDILAWQQSPKEGMPPSVTPAKSWYGGWNSMWQGGTVMRIPPQLYQYYGAIAIPAEFYDGMKVTVEWMRTKAPGHGWEGQKDHNPPSAPTGDLAKKLIDEPTKELIATIGYYDYLRGMSEMATALGKQDDATTYGRLAETVKEAYNRRFFDAATGIYIDPSDHNIPKEGKKMYQTIQAMALWFDLVPAGHETQVLNQLVASLHTPGMAAGKYDLNTGFVGTRYLIRALVKFGRTDEAFNLTRKTEYPSFFTTCRNGVFWETWCTYRTQCTLAAGIDFLMEEGLAGIRPDPTSPGFKHFILKPEPVADVSWVESHHESPYGRILSNWNRENKDNLLTWDIVIPASSSATIFVPTTDPESVKESGSPARNATGVKFLRTEENRAVYAVSAGVYRFTSRFPSVPAAVKGVPIPFSQMKASATSSQDATCSPDKAIDGDRGTCWLSSTNEPTSPAITLDLGGRYTINELRYLPRQDDAPTGKSTRLKGVVYHRSDNDTTGITRYKVYVSTNGTEFQEVSSGRWRDESGEERIARFKPVSATHVKLEADLHVEVMVDQDGRNVALDPTRSNVSVGELTVMQIDTPAKGTKP